MDNLEKRIQLLETKIKALEKNEKMFGRSYSQIGDSSSDFLIKTRGLVKIQWGSKFIDLIKNGKINSEKPEFIFSVSKKENIGKNEGIYITNDLEVFLKLNNTTIPLAGTFGNTYVSFLEKQTSTSDEKQTALLNIGLYYNSLSDVDTSALQNGIIYVESELKLYLIKDGKLSVFTVPISNKFNSLIIVQLNGLEGAIVIMGLGRENAIYLNSMVIYSKGSSIVIGNGILDIITISGSEILTNAILSINNIQSSLYCLNTKKCLYLQDGNTVLSVDKLNLSSGNPFQIPLYSAYWLNSNNIVSSIDDSTSDLILNLAYTNTFKVGDILAIYGKLESSEDSLAEYNLQFITVTSITDTSISTTDSISGNIINSVIFLVEDSTLKHSLVLNNNKLQILKYGNLSDELIDTVEHTTVGLLDDTDFGIKSDNINGILNNVALKNIVTDSNSDLSVASVGWVKSKIEDPLDCIYMFYGSTVPTGYKLCDGTNGTPNLTNILNFEDIKFLMKI